MFYSISKEYFSVDDKSSFIARLMTRGHRSSTILYDYLYLEVERRLEQRQRGDIAESPVSWSFSLLGCCCSSEIIEWWHTMAVGHVPKDSSLGCRSTSWWNHGGVVWLDPYTSNRKTIRVISQAGLIKCYRRLAHMQWSICIPTEIISNHFGKKFKDRPLTNWITYPFWTHF